MNDKSQPLKMAQGSSAAKVEAPGVRLRAADSGDDEFLMAVLASTRTDELAMIEWDPAQAQAFLRLQFTAQLRNYSAVYPNAENNIILLDEQPVGRMLVDRGGDEISLIDIALLCEHRNAGTGSALIQNLLREAAAASKPVKLHVLHSNPALRLYERLGFSPVSRDEVYLEMKWSSHA